MARRGEEAVGRKARVLSARELALHVRTFVGINHRAGLVTHRPWQTKYAALMRHYKRRNGIVVLRPHANEMRVLLMSASRLAKVT